ERMKLRRKLDHIKFSKDAQVGSNFFEYIQLPYYSLPEVNFDEINMKCYFLGKEIDAPIIIDSITGGEKISEKINVRLAIAAEKEKIPLFLGSIRPGIETGNLKSYKVRKYAPSIPIIGNIGVVNLKEKGMMKKVEGAIKDIDADGIAIHLNPIQEVLQIEGDKNFEGCVEVLKEACDVFDFPVIVKEVGFGICGEVAKILDGMKIEMINVAGAGGTSWALIELMRRKKIGKSGFECFSNFGIPTAQALIETLKNTKKKVICSGGIRNGIEVAKAICLGADYAGAAYPFLEAYFEGKIEERIVNFKNELRVAIFYTGSKNLNELKGKKSKLKIFGRLRELIG
ncbi:MAG: type 2 isopentenyl-diphosphate Delta-isomerase, partial [Candidatus Micrarchaeia archaeon]